MQPSWLIDHLYKEGAVIKGAPMSFIIIFIICLILAYLVARMMYKERLDTAKDLVSFYKEGKAISKLSEPAIKELKTEWGKKHPKIIVRNRTFSNETVPLDGYAYLNCKFSNVTFLFNGDAPFDFSDNDVLNYTIRTDNPGISGMVLFLEKSGNLRPGIRVGEVGSD